MTNGFGLPPSFVKQKRPSSLLMKANIFTVQTLLHEKIILLNALLFLHVSEM